MIRKINQLIHNSIEHKIPNLWISNRRIVNRSALDTKYIKSQDMIKSLMINKSITDARINIPKQYHSQKKLFNLCNQNAGIYSDAKNLFVYSKYLNCF